jgi:hypothetical protein
MIIYNKYDSNIFFFNFFNSFIFQFAHKPIHTNKFALPSISSSSSKSRSYKTSSGKSPHWCDDDGVVLDDGAEMGGSWCHHWRWIRPQCYPPWVRLKEEERVSTTTLWVSIGYLGAMVSGERKHDRDIYKKREKMNETLNMIRTNEALSIQLDTHIKITNRDEDLITVKKKRHRMFHGLLFFPFRGCISQPYSFFFQQKKYVRSFDINIKRHWTYIRVNI